MKTGAHFAIKMLSVQVFVFIEQNGGVVLMITFR